MIAAPLTASLHATIGAALLTAIAALEATQDDLFALCVLSMWLVACLLPFVVTGR